MAQADNQNTTNLIHDDRAYLLVGLIAAALSGGISAVLLVPAARTIGIL
jgi:hypothetical protein